MASDIHQKDETRTTDVENDAAQAEKPPAEKKELTAAEEDAAGKVYPPMIQVLPTMMAIFMALFLTSLDRTIIATAIPVLTDRFKSVGDIGWYTSAYLLTACSSQLFYGRIYTFYSPKWVFLSSITLFELGSLICGVAPSSAVFIVGRAVAGVGTSGIFSGGVVLTVYLVPLRRRPSYMGVMGGIMIISAIVGPLLGGAFTTKLSWRWCFYINLPIGGLTIILTLLCLHTTRAAAEDDQSDETKLTLRQKIERLDPLGTIVFLPAVVCLLFALQWGGSKYPWKEARIIVLFVLSAILTVIFSVIQVWKQENATLPPRILKYRSVTAASFFAFCISGAMTSTTMMLPIWFQAIQGVDALQSGIRTLPLIISFLVASIISGGMTSKIGYYTPFLILCAIILAVGSGLLSTLQVDSGKAAWIGFQVCFGFGIGLGQQQAGLAAQTVLPSKDVPTGVALKFFGQSLGGAIFVTIGQSVLSNRLVHNLTKIPGLMASHPDLDPSQIVNMGALELRQVFGPQYAEAVLFAFNKSLDSVFQVGIYASCLAFIGALFVEWKSIKGIEIKKGGF
ncbi:major facilitator superfamily domain-containing protein [Rhexocercosporidium sp. MPI-PUGE-AT-0058]|nr:major facilitator superfamily domain-containing protein [Rhexocercosporidium sp. MPI-PUGE-AT-0058]